MSGGVELVIFDCDGVLVDSERISNIVFAEMLGELGLHLTLADMFEHFVGRSMAQGLEIIERMLGAPPPPDFADAFRARSSAALAQQVQPVRGIEAALAALEEIRLPYCVASSGDHTKMRMTLGATGLLPRFDGRMFSATEVARGKPNPDVFLFAAERMRASCSSRVVVVEDTAVGVQAGVTAGMTVFGYAELTDSAKLIAAGAARTFADMRELPSLIRDLGRR